MAGRRAPNDTVRRTWDDETFARRAAQRAAQDDGDVPKRRKVPVVPAKDRVEMTPHAPGERLDADAIAGTTVVVPDGASKSEAGGFYCKHCDVLSHDSSAYLNHMNSRAHQAVIGVAMRVKRSTAEDVRAAFAAALARRVAREAACGQATVTLDELLEQRRSAGAAARAERRDRHRERKEKAEEGALIGDEDRLRAEEMRRCGLPTSF
jgi:U4/U6.U5 tri-snRNP component SNU23